MTRESDFSVPDFETFGMLPHAITLLGMSGVGKTHFSTRLRWASKQHRDSANWFHFSADYRIGTAYLAELFQWLARIGYAPRRSGILANIGCPDAGVGRLERTLDQLASETGQPVHVIGHSLGGLQAR